MKIAHPTLPASLIPLLDAADFLVEEDTISGALVEDTWLTTDDLEHASIIESRLSRVDFSSVNVSRFDVMDVEFKGCNFTATKFPDSTWRRVVIEGARCSGMHVANSSLKHTVFKNCKLELVNFRFSELENVVFEDCAIEEVDFYDATLRNVEFVGCTIKNITFMGAKMFNVDVSKSTLDDIKGVNTLKGVTMSYDQILGIAPLLAAGAGIRIK